MGLEQFDKIYDKIINEMKIISIPGGFSYKINDEAFEPILYKNICICASSLNDDPFHILKRLNKRSKKEYTIKTILTIIKRYIDKDPSLENIFKNKNRKIYSCSIQSKEFNDIKISVTFEKNEIRDIFSSGIENAKYFCFIYTILSNEMHKDKNDLNLTTESIELEVD